MDQKRLQIGSGIILDGSINNLALCLAPKPDGFYSLNCRFKQCRQYYQFAVLYQVPQFPFLMKSHPKQ